VAWPTAVVLGLVALARPVAGVVAEVAGVPLGQAVPVAITAGVSLVWIVVATVRRRGSALQTLVAAGLVQAVASAALALVTTWALHGHPDGPLVHPVQLVPALVVGTLWGLLCGTVAQALRRAGWGGRRR
jgi:hypothetical protein